MQGKDPDDLLATMPMSRWIAWKAYERYRGPLSPAVREDFYAALLAMQVAAPHIKEEDRDVLRFLPPWADKRSYAQWMYIPEGELDGPDEFEVE